MTTIRDALHTAQQCVESDSASLDAQALLCHVLGVERAYLLAHPEDAITPEQETEYSGLVERLTQGEPLAYILGRRAFYDRELVVSPAVLIPRPETELLLEKALAYVKQRPQAVVVDVGTGSGALAVTLAAHAPQAQVYATDISADALTVARHNAEGLKVTFYQGNLLQPLIERHIKVDLLMANLPYIASADLVHLDVSQYEPHLALDGGADGLDLIRELLAQAPGVCNPGALALLEIGSEQGMAVRELAEQAFGMADVEILQDYAGHDRIAKIQATSA